MTNATPVNWECGICGELYDLRSHAEQCCEGEEEEPAEPKKESAGGLFGAGRFAF